MYANRVDHIILNIKRSNTTPKTNQPSKPIYLSYTVAALPTNPFLNSQPTHLSYPHPSSRNIKNAFATTTPSCVLPTLANASS
jgi:hypothetical protein